MSLTDTYDDDDHPLGADFEDDIDFPTDEEEQAGGADAGDAADPSDEERARTMGWKPFAEWRGPPDEWRTAKEFLEVADQNAPVLREVNRRVTKDMARLQRQFDEYRTETQRSTAALLEEIRGMGANLRTADQRAIERIRSELLQARDGAVEAGDKAEFDRIEAELVKLPPANAAPPSPPPPPPAAPPGAAPQISSDEKATIDTWIAANPWFLRDDRRKQAMMAMHTSIRNTRPTMALKDQLALAKARIVQDMPDAFEDEEIADVARQPDPAPQPAAAAAPRRVPPAVSRPTGGGPPGQRASVWDQVPQEERRAAQAAYEHFKRVNQDPHMPASEYVTLYLDPKADYLALREKRPARRPA